MSQRWIGQRGGREAREPGGLGWGGAGGGYRGGAGGVCGEKDRERERMACGFVFFKAPSGVSKRQRARCRSKRERSIKGS